MLPSHVKTVICLQVNIENEKGTATISFRSCRVPGLGGCTSQMLRLARPPFVSGKIRRESED